jgi:hypothetical protein
VTGQQDVAGGRHRYEFRQPFEQAEEQGFDNRLAFHENFRMDDGALLVRAFN